MAREVFVDTSALYALVNKRDAHHTLAVRSVAKVIAAGRRLVVSDYVAAETANLAKARGGAFLADRVLALIEQSAGIRMEWIGVTQFDLTKALFRKHADHGYSFTDCSSFIVMREMRIRGVLTTDRHFAEAGFQCLMES